MFKPTYLYIKQHSITKKCYFGKTVKNPLKYKGSGIAWLNHIKKHGTEFVETIWYKLFVDENECKRIAELFSIQQDIVKSKRWLNCIADNGIDGMPVGTKMSERTKEKISKANFGKKRSMEQRIRISHGVLSGTKLTPDAIQKSADSRRNIARSKATCDKISKSSVGKRMSAEARAKMSLAKLGRKDSEEQKLAKSKRMVGNSFAKGYTFSDEQKLNMSKSRLGRVVSKETKKLMSESQKGRTFSEETKRLMALAKLGCKVTHTTVVCPHCSKEGPKPNMVRWHFNNCKYKE